MGNNYKRVLFNRIVSFLLVFSILLPVGNISTVSAKETDDYKTFSQGDPRWGSHHVPGTTYTVARAGCFITAIAVLMAYANKDLRDVDTFNPAILSDKLSFVGNGLVSTSVVNADSTFHKGKDIDGNFSAEEAKKHVIEQLEQGNFVTIMAGPPIAAGSTHFSPVVGLKDGKPIVWDVNNGKNSNWDAWASAGIQQIDVFYSDKVKSTEVLEGYIKSDSKEEKSSKSSNSSTDIIPEECNLVGMRDVSLEEYQEYVELMGSEALTVAERVAIAEQKSRITTSNWASVFMKVFYFIGLLLCLYSVVLIVACIFDYVNTFIDISLLGIVTFGSLKIDRDRYGGGEDLIGYKRGIEVENFLGIIAFRVIVSFGVGLFLLSDLFRRLLYWIVLR